MSASLKVSNEGIVGTQVAIPMVIVGSSQSNLTYAANQQIFAFAAAHYAPSIHTRWGAEVNADMTCTIAGQLETK